MTTAFHVPRENLTAALPRAQHLAPILAAVRDHGIGMLVVPQGRDRFDLPKDLRRRPWIALIGDDPDAALGPDGFHRKSLGRLIRKAGAAVVVAGAPMPGIYASAAMMAAQFRKNTILVETRPEQEIPWIGLLQAVAPGLPTLLSTVKGGMA